MPTCVCNKVPAPGCLWVRRFMPAQLADVLQLLGTLLWQMTSNDMDVAATSRAGALRNRTSDRKRHVGAEREQGKHGEVQWSPSG